jgi:hypothetical protein
MYYVLSLEHTSMVDYSKDSRSKKEEFSPKASFLLEVWQVY